MRNDKHDQITDKRKRSISTVYQIASDFSLYCYLLTGENFQVFIQYRYVRFRILTRTSQFVKDMAVLRNPCRRVEAEDACVVLEGGPCSPCEERAAISDQIKQLKAKYDTIGTARNAIHDPFIHKLPPEIASHILRLSLPTLKNRKDDAKGVHGQWQSILKEWAVPLKLGSVCRKWRELAWATPDLWTTLYIRIKPSMTLSTAESLPVNGWADQVYFP